MGIPLCVICCFSLASFNICSLRFIFVNLINMFLGGVLPWIYPVWDSLAFLDLDAYFLHHSGEVFKYYLLKYFLMTFLFVFFFWDTYDSNVRAFNIVPEVSEVVLISFNYFFLFSSLLHLFPPFYLPPHLSYLLPVILLLVPSRVLLISVIALFIIDWLFFISSRSLLSFLASSQSFSLFYLSVIPFVFKILGSSLLSLFWILFQVDFLSPPLLFGLVGIYHIPLPDDPHSQRLWHSQ